MNEASPSDVLPQALLHEPLSIRELTSIDAFGSIASEWDELVQRSATPSVNLTHAWLTEWWGCHRSKGRSLLILLAYEKGRLVGAAPLMKSTTRILGLPVRTIEFITMMPVAASPSNCSGELDFVLTTRREEVVESFLRHLKQQHRWEYVRLYPIPENSATLPVLQRVAGHDRSVLQVREAFVNACIRMGNGWDDYINTVSKQFRRTIRQHEQKLQKLGVVRCVEYRTPLEVEVMYTDVLAIEEASWKWGKGVAINSAGFRGFYERFALAAAKLGRMHLWMIELDGRSIAYDYCISFGDRVQSLKKSYRNEYRQCFPGGVLDLHAFAAMAGDGAREINLLWGDEEQKKKWAPVMERHVEVRFVSSTNYARFIEAAFFRTDFVGLLARADSWLKRGLRFIGFAPEWSELTREDQVGGGDRRAVRRSERLEPGMAVRVRGRREVLMTLDGSGALQGIVFLPEMLSHCGRVLHVGAAAAMAEAGALPDESRKGGVVLRDPRCDGKEHDACDKACLFLWREEWLERVDGAAPAEKWPTRVPVEDAGRGQTGPDTEFGQPGFVGLPKLVSLARAMEREPTSERASPE